MSEARVVVADYLRRARQLRDALEARADEMTLIDSEEARTAEAQLRAAWDQCCDVVEELGGAFTEPRRYRR